MAKNTRRRLMRPIMPIRQSLMPNGSLVGLKFRAGAKISPGPITARSPASKMMPNRMHSLMPLRPGDGQGKGCAPRCGAAMRRAGVPSTDRGPRRLIPSRCGDRPCHYRRRAPRCQSSRRISIEWPLPEPPLARSTSINVSRFSSNIPVRSASRVCT